ncbi:DUF3502 domain-containing protein [Paenibacillus psychroresistens]|uniref:DUF3502 domain-containing protein n=1 Tax=Paenibacillus psychroresistens TaxID=1778678 RepID=UPI001D0565DF|nr:DUF3502 domain-containing protein [Paenibacillus psychroresistens]
MKRRLWKGLLIVMLVVVLAFLLVSCFKSNEPIADLERDKSPAASLFTGDHSKEVKLVGYLLGDEPKGMPDVLDALNVKLKKDINATLELNYINWSDVSSKYSLVLASGEDIDFIFAADWNYYISESTKGAYMPLNPEMLNTYMPRHMKKLSETALKATYINGKSYMIPTSTPDRKVNVALFRKDIMEKAGLKEIKHFSEIEPYLAEAKKSFPNMIPLNLDSQYDLVTPYGHLLNEKVAWPGAPFDSGDPMAQGVLADHEDPNGEIVSMLEEPMLSAQKYAATIMKGWYDKGYISKNPYANKVRSKDNFCEGKSGIAFGNSTDISATMIACKELGIDVFALPMLYPSGKAAQPSSLNNGVAIAANSKNPQRTLEALDLIMEDPAYVYLTYFGIEGKNYIVTADNKLGLPKGVTSQNNTYPPDASGFWFVNKDLFKPMTSWTDSYISLHDKMDSYLEPVLYQDFNFNSENIKSEVANIKSVSTQYAQSIYFGAVDNVDQAFDNLDKMLKIAGIDKVKDEVEKQAAAFITNK